MKLKGVSIILIFLIYACSWGDNDKNYNIVKEENNLIIGVNQPCAGSFYPVVYSFNQQDSSFLYYFSKSDSSLRINSINSEQQQKTIHLSSLFKSRVPYSVYYGAYLFMETSKLLWIDPSVSDSIYQINLKTFDIEKVVYRGGMKGYTLYNFAGNIEINSIKNQLLLGIFANTEYTYGLFNINSDSLVLEKELGVRPHDYKKKDMYIRSGMLTKINSDSFLISYYYSDSVDFYVKNEFSKRICMKSDSSDKFTGFEGEHGDISSVSKYFRMNQRYNQLMYDSGTCLYYRVFSFEEEFNGKITMSKKWSICVYDEKFTKIHEQIFSDKEYFKGYVFLLNSKLYIPNVKKSELKSFKDSSTVVFDIYKLKELQN